LSANFISINVLFLILGFSIWFVPLCPSWGQHLQLWRATCPSYSE